MKKTLIAIITIATLAAACNKVEIIDGGQNTTSGIVFNCTETKAAVTSANEIKAFGVFAKQNLGEDGTPEALNWFSLLENEKVYRNNTDEEFIYDNLRYWVDNRTFRFFAYYPYLAADANPTEGLTGITAVGNGNGFPAFNMTYVTPESANADMLVSTTVLPIDGDPDTAYPTVDIDFHHALSRVSVLVSKHQKNENNRIEITDIEFGGIAKSATYNTLNDSWSSHAGTLEPSHKSLTLNEGDISFTNVFSGIYLPQNVNKGNKNIYIKISYKFYTKDSEGVWQPDEDSYSANASLPAGSWEPSKSYTYKMTLSAIDNTISFKSPTVDTWGTPNPAGNLIIQ